MAEEKEYGLLIAAIVAIVSIVGLVILFSRGGGAPVAKVMYEGNPSMEGNPGSFRPLPEMDKGNLDGSGLSGQYQGEYYDPDRNK